jgi:hypothetical protein
LEVILFFLWLQNEFANQPAMVNQEEKVAQEEHMLDEENEVLANLLLQLGDIGEPKLVEEVNENDEQLEEETQID